MKDGEFEIQVLPIEEDESSPYPPPTTLEGLAVKKTGWEVKMLEQDDSSVIVKIACRSETREWYSLRARISKKQLKLIGG